MCIRDSYVGYHVGSQAGGTALGIVGALLATFAVCLPALTIMMLVTRFFLRLKGNRLVAGAMNGMRPVVIGMIAAAALLLIFPRDPADNSFIDGWSWLLFGAVFAGTLRRINPILLIVALSLIHISHRRHRSRIRADSLSRCGAGSSR